MDEDKTSFQLQGDIFSEEELIKTWKELTNKPFPSGKIRAVVLEKEDADKVWEALRNASNIRHITIPEYGKELVLDKTTTAVTFIETLSDNTKGWMILIRKDSRVSVTENLNHELRHIIDGDITLDGEAFGEAVK